MCTPKPRTTSIWKSKIIPELFYEGFEKKYPEETLVIAFHYKGKSFDLGEIVEIKPKFTWRKGTGFVKIPRQPLMGIINSIEPDNEKGDQRLVIRIKDCESPEEDLFAVTEIRKERRRTN